MNKNLLLKLVYRNDPILSSIYRLPVLKDYTLSITMKDCELNVQGELPDIKNIEDVEIKVNLIDG